MHCIGLDVHSAMTAVCVLDGGGKKVREFKIHGPLSEVVAKMKALQKELGELRICFEASAAAGWLCDQLRGGRGGRFAWPIPARCG